MSRIPIFIDFETTISKHITLRKLPLREYLSKSNILGFAIATGDEEPLWIPEANITSDLLAFMRSQLESDDRLWVAHEASFDIRVLVHKLGLPYPKHWICTREASMCAFPNHPGGHGLANLGITLNLASGGKTGKGSEVGRMAANELAEYCKQDVRLCRDIYNICRRRIPDCEWQIGEICSRVKEVELHIDHDAVGTALVEFTKQADTYGAMLLEALSDDQQISINLDETEHVRSVKPAQVKRLLLENLGFATRTISTKKINPVALSTAPDETKNAIEAASKANKALSHKRRTVKFTHAVCLDAELNWYGCIAEDTPIETPAGPVPIQYVNPAQTVWDGSAFVPFERLIDKGVRRTILFGGVWMTPNHPIQTDKGLVPVCRVLSNPNSYRVPVIASEIKPSLENHSETKLAMSGLSGSSAIADDVALPPSTISGAAARSDVGVALGGCTTSKMRISSLTTRSAGIGGIAGIASLPGAQTPDIRNTKITEAEEYEIASRLFASSFATLKPSMDGNAETNSLSTVKTTTETTEPEISASFHSSPTSKINRQPCVWTHPLDLLPAPRSSERINCERIVRLCRAGSDRGFAWKKYYEQTDMRQVRVYDLLNAGPSHRFQAGSLIVSNSHTGRFSSRASGKGLNLHNMPKHDKEVAKLIRSMFRLSSGFCFVRADEMNVEYRVNCLLSKCAYGAGMFENDVLADPYVAFGQTCTGTVIDRKTAAGDAARQLFKAAVLGLGFMMGLERWVGELLKAMMKPKPDFRLEDLQRTCESQRWMFPHGRHCKGILTKLGCDPAVVVTAFHTRRIFHGIHPEFKLLADWLIRAATHVCMGCTQATLDEMYLDNPNAPLRQHVDLQLREDFGGYSLAVYVNGWPQPAVVWRDLGIRDIPKYGPSLSFMNGMKGYRSLHASLAIENVVQASARIATCAAKLDLEARGLPYIFSVHDELLPVVPATPEWVCKARTDLLDVLGPHRADASPWRWAVAINPDEVNVSRSWYETDVGKLDPRLPTNAAWWAALPDHPELLESLS